MPRLPTVTSQISATSTGVGPNGPQTRASSAAFGGQIGGALQSLAGGVDDVGSGLQALAEKRRKEEVINATAQFDFTPRELAIRNETPANGEGYHKRVTEEYEAAYTQAANSIPDDKARTEFVNRMRANAPNVSSRAASYQYGIAAENSKNQANSSLSTLQNKITSDPTQYDTYVKQGMEVIDTRDDISPTVREGMKISYRQDSAKSRFIGMLDRATTPEDLDNVKAELEGKTKGTLGADQQNVDWRAEMNPTDYNTVSNNIDAARKQLYTKADTDARAAIETLDERSKGDALIPPEEMTAVQEVVKRSQNPVTISRMARIVRDQDIIRNSRKLPPSQMREVINAQRENVGLPAPVSSAVNDASAQFGVSAGYIGSTLKREYGALLKPDANGNVDYGKGTQITGADGKPTSSAVGPMQFTKGTFIQVMRSAGVADRIGVDVDKMSDTQLLELRKDPRVAVMAGAALASQNKRQMEIALGRNVSDAELYMAHFLGSGGATKLIKAMQGDPDQSASQLLPEQAGANAPVFRKGGKELTVTQLYNNLSRGFTSDPTQVAYGDNETRQRMLANTEKKISADPVSHAQETGTFSVTPLDASGGFTARGAEARSMADYYGIPVQDMKPFTENEANDLKKQILDGDAQSVVGLMASIQSMGSEAARGALKQLDQKDSVFAYAGGLQLSRGQANVASDIIRGQKVLEENPAIKDTLGINPRDISTSFSSIVGNSLAGVAPRARQSIQDAALAYYTQKALMSGASGRFDNNLYEQSVQAVMGGTEGNPAVATINGEPTVLPRGVTEKDMTTAMDRMTVNDWSRMSKQGVPPRYATGDVIDPEDLADEAKLKAIGGGEYQIMLDDGEFAITGARTGDGGYEVFVFTPDKDDIDAVLTRGAAGASEQDTQVVEDDAPKPVSPAGAYDENGMWIGADR